MKKVFGKKILAVLVALVVLIAGAVIAKPMLAQISDSPSGNTKTVPADRAGVKVSTNTEVNEESISKTETVYVKVNPDGSVKDTTVVNWFHFDDAVPAQLTDPVKLDNVKALNGSFTVKNSAEGVILTNLEEGKKDIFYSGQTSKNLPVKTEIKYYLNGREIKPKELVGKTGEVKIVIDLKNQMKSWENISYGNSGRATPVKKEIYTPLVTMISLELPIETFSHVEAPDGMITVVGQTMNVNWMLFPYPDAQAVLTMHAEDFTMGSMQMVVKPQMPPLSDYEEQKSKLEELSAGLQELDQAMQQVETGSDQLASGQTQITDGIAKIQQGLKELVLLSQAEEKLASGALLINNSLLQAVQPYKENPLAKDLAEPLVAALQKQQELLKAMVEGGTIDNQSIPAMSTGTSGLQTAQNAIDQLGAGLEKSSSGTRQLNEAIRQIRAQGIAKIQSGVNATLDELDIGLAQIKIMKEKVDQFDSFMGKGQNIKSSVQFIIQTEELK